MLLQLPPGSASATATLFLVVKNKKTYLFICLIQVSICFTLIYVLMLFWNLHSSWLCDAPTRNKCHSAEPSNAHAHQCPAVPTSAQLMPHELTQQCLRPAGRSRKCSLPTSHWHTTLSTSAMDPMEVSGPSELHFFQLYNEKTNIFNTKSSTPQKARKFCWNSKSSTPKCTKILLE